MNGQKTGGRWAPPSVRLIVLLYVLLLVSNAFDAHATLDAVRAGAVELNPVMAFALSFGAAYFIGVKMLLAGGLGLALAVLARRRRLAWYGLIGVSFIYGAVLAWQIALALCGSHLMIVLPS
ncbi:MAG TPA: DUF5658 family protein [Patescibacteria group bacterium]|nr:DUF5658 family protein [Patescibacteria group bacterium]